MKSIRLVNIRSLVDCHEVRIAPITVLVGQNSSGKSTFARFFPLLRQSSEVLAREPLLWFGRFVDFGSAEEATSRIGSSGGPGFDVTFDVDKGSLINRRRRYFELRTPQGVDVIPVTATVRYQGSQGEKRQLEFGLSFMNVRINVHISDVSVVRLIINGRDFTDIVQGKLYAPNWSACFPNLIFRDDTAKTDPFTKLIANYVRAHTHGKSQEDRVALLTRSITYSSLENLLEQVKNPGAADSIWGRTTAVWHERTPDFMKLRDWIVGSRLLELFQVAGEVFGSHCARVRYITPIRASAERYYRRQGLALGEIDPQGQNVAMFLHNLSSMEKQRFTTWMGKHFGYAVDTVASSGHISMVIRDAADAPGSTPINLADTGFGFSQIIPILIQIWTAMTQRSASRLLAAPPIIFSIEQPELHLHPRLQAVLADLFIQVVKAARSNGVEVRLVIETHSEQIINRLGRRVSEHRTRRDDATGREDTIKYEDAVEREDSIGRDDVAVVLFDKPSFAIPTDVQVTGYDDEGFITNWPYGFFEANV